MKIADSPISKKLRIKESALFTLRAPQPPAALPSSWQEMIQSAGSQYCLSDVPSIWEKGGLYTIKEDEEGYQYVVRYSVIWESGQRSSPQAGESLSFQVMDLPAFPDS